MKTTFIYVLKDPQTEKIRYVGKANDIKDALCRHVRNAKSGKKWHVSCWIRTLFSSGLRPLIESVDEVPIPEWEQWEVAYIEFFRESGFDLTNATPGGESGPSRAGRKSTPETRAKQSAALLGNKHPAFGKPSPHRGIKRSPQTIAKLIAINTGKKHSPETLAKMAVSQQLRRLKERQ